MRALFGVLITGAIALTAGVIGYQAGLASSIAAAGGVVWLGGGFAGLGFLFFLMFVGFLFFAIGGRRRAWAHGGAGGPGAWGHGPMGGHGPWGGSDDARRQWVAEAHRRLHQEDAAAASAAGTADTTASPTDRPSAG